MADFNLDTEMDMLVVGCGLSGAVVARHFAEKGKKVTIWECRNHIAGNMFDYIDEHGILVHQYGPHTFHTNDKELYDYINRFGEWIDFRLTCGAEINGKCTPTPFNFQTIDDFYLPEEAASLKQRIKFAFGERRTATVLEVLEHPDAQISGYARFLFEKDYSLYTAKQWGVSASEIHPDVLKRVPLRFSYDVGYFDDIYQVMPAVSYDQFFQKLLGHPNINVQLGIDALNRLSVSHDGSAVLLDDLSADFPIVYTGALDELFRHENGALPYRSLRFEWIHKEADSFQDMPVVAYPQALDFTRITEYKKLPLQDVPGTSYAIEYPLTYHYQSGVEPYYPVLTEQSNKQYAAYRAKASCISNLYCCGRLADFQYYNMDQALRKALDLCRDISL